MTLESVIENKRKKIIKKKRHLRSKTKLGKHRLSNNKFSIVVAGKAGQGVKSTACLIAKILHGFGFHVFCSHDYQSLITGGHNFSYVTFSNLPIESNKKQIDILISLDGNLSKHVGQINNNTLVLLPDTTQVEVETKAQIVKLPLEIFRTKNSINRRMLNTSFVGYLFDFIGVYSKVWRDKLLGFIQEKIRQHYSNSENIQAFLVGYSFGWQNFVEFSNSSISFLMESLNMSRINKNRINNRNKSSTKLIEGNEAVALGALNAGLSCYYAYPMTPATSILGFLKKQANNFSLKVVQPENEISVINMALGSSYAGCKTMVGTSGGGFALMTEALSMSGMAELPVVIVLSQRGGPSTGVPTYTSQSDLLFAVHAGHGDFPKVVIAPADNEQAFTYTQVAFHLSDRFGVPSIILIDKHISSSYTSLDFNLKKIKSNRKQLQLLWSHEAKVNEKGIYKIYKLTKDGISPRAFPGQAIVKANSYEHDESGLTTEDPKVINSMQEKRFRKKEALVSMIEKIDSVKAYDFKATRTKVKLLVLAFGSTIMVLKDVLRNLAKQGVTSKLVQPVLIEPFPKKQFLSHIKGFKNKTIIVEQNSTSQFSKLLNENGIKVRAKSILKYDARPFYIEELEEKIKKILKL